MNDDFPMTEDDATSLVNNLILMNEMVDDMQAVVRKGGK